jgi:hypothetical protein
LPTTGWGTGALLWSDMTRFEEPLLQRFDRDQEVRVRTRRGDRSTVDLPIWIVTVDQVPYVRSFKAEEGAWYRRARREGKMTLVVGDRAVPVVVEAGEGDELNRRVSEAFTTKYAGSQGFQTMISSPVAATTLRLLPAD